MRKIIAVILSVLILGMLVSCKNGEPIAEESENENNNETTEETQSEISQTYLGKWFADGDFSSGSYFILNDDGTYALIQNGTETKDTYWINDTTSIEYSYNGKQIGEVLALKYIVLGSDSVEFPLIADGNAFIYDGYEGDGKLYVHETAFEDNRKVDLCNLENGSWKNEECFLIVYPNGYAVWGGIDSDDFEVGAVEVCGDGRFLLHPENGEELEGQFYSSHLLSIEGFGEDLTNECR